MEGETAIRVLLEKPAATTLPDLARLEQAVRKSRVQYSITLDMRTEPIFQAARRAVPLLAATLRASGWTDAGEFTDIPLQPYSRNSLCHGGRTAALP